MEPTPRRESRRITGTQLVVRATRAERDLVQAVARSKATTISDLIRRGLISEGVPIER